MTILITHPAFEEPGGVGQYYGKLKGKFSMTVEHYILGKRPDEGGVLSKFLRIIRDYGIFMMKELREKERALAELSVEYTLLKKSERSGSTSGGAGHRAPRKRMRRS